MASIGLAMVQGEKNAQELALGHMNTLSGMAKAATDAETQGQYFRPGAVALRDLTDSESQQAAQNIVDNKELIKGLSIDPETFAPQVLEKTMGKSSLDSSWVLEPMDAAGNYRAVEYASDATKGQGGVLRSVPLGNKAQVAGILAQNLTATSLDQLKQIAAMRSASDASDIKRKEKLEDHIGKFTYETAPTLASLERRTAMTVQGGITEAGIGANAQIKKAYIGLMDDGTNRSKNAMTHLHNSGFSYDKDSGEMSYLGKPISSMSADEALAAVNKAGEIMTLTGQSGAAGLPSLASPGTVRPRINSGGRDTTTEGEYMARQRANSGVVAQGLPDKSVIDAAATAKARRLAAQKLTEEQAAKQEFYRLQEQNTAGYKPRFY